MHGTIPAYGKNKAANAAAPSAEVPAQEVPVTPEVAPEVAEAPKPAPEAKPAPVKVGIIKTYVLNGIKYNRHRYEDGRTEDLRA